MVTIVKGQWSVVTPVVTIAKGQWSHLWLQSLFSGVEHICACFSLKASLISGHLKFFGKLYDEMTFIQQNCQDFVS